MWLYFNSTGQLLESLEHGSPARAGATDFEIFAFFEGVNTDVSYGDPSIKFYRPVYDGDTYPLLAMAPSTKTFHLAEGENSTYFQNGVKYEGFCFNFSSFNVGDNITILLDTPGLWEAVITLYGANSELNVQGRIGFFVENENYYEGETELNLDSVLIGIFTQISTKLNIRSTRYMRVLDNFDDYVLDGFPSAEFNINDIIYNKEDKHFYKLISYEYEEGVNPELIIEDAILIKDITLATTLDDLKGRPVVAVLNGVHYLAMITEQTPGYYMFEIRNMANEDLWRNTSAIANTTFFNIINGATYYDPVALHSDVNRIFTMNTGEELLSNNDFNWLYNSPNSRILYDNRYYEKSHRNGIYIYFASAKTEVITVDGHQRKKTYVVVLNTTNKRLSAGTIDVDFYSSSQTDDLLATKQNVLTFDTVPTTNSTNPVTSGGIKTAISNATTRANLVSIIGEATQALNGLMSATDKRRLDTLYSLLGEQEDADNVVDTINEILAIFSNYPEGVDIFTALSQKVNISDIVNNLTSNDTNKPLSAKQGKVLKDYIDVLNDTSLITFTVENHSTPNIAVAFVKNTDKKIVNSVQTTSVTFVIPSTISQGWIGSCTLYLGSQCQFSISNSSNFDVYCVLDGRVRDLSEWQSSVNANVTLEVMAECNGYNVRLFARQIDN